MNINNSTNDSTKKSTHKNLFYVKLNIKYSFSQADLLCENEKPVFWPARTKNQLCIPVSLFYLC